MLIRFFVVLLGLCGLGLILCGLLETICLYGLSDVYHVIPLEGDASSVEDRVRKALRSLQGKLYFVDLGLDAEGQMNVELLLRGRSYAKLCAPEQMNEELRWEKDRGTGIDQGNRHKCDLSE